MKKHLTTVIIILVALTGLSLLLYPSVSDYINSRNYKRAILNYTRAVEQLSNEEYEAILSAAREYNKELGESGLSPVSLKGEKLEYYNSLLDITGTGIMGYVQIPSIKVSLPIYHGFDEEILQAGVGHIAWSSLPVGGESSHSILSGHRGLPSARLFTDIDQLVRGDIFAVNVLNEVLIYEVDQVETVEPYMLNRIQIEEGMDYCTLVTCTPYGINTHRLLVRGHRIENPVDSGNVDFMISAGSEVYIIDSKLISVIVMAPIALVILPIVSARRKKSQRNKGDDMR